MTRASTGTVQPSVKIVEAGPQHVAFIAWVVMAAARSHLPRGMFDIALDRDEAEVLRFLEGFVNSEIVHFGHHGGFLVAEVGGQPAAGLSGYLDSERGGERIMQGYMEAVGKFGITQAEAEEGLTRASSMFKVVAHPEDDPWVVEWVATKPEFRRQGLVDRLLQEIMERGRTRGLTDAHISVFIDNDRAQRAYEKAGFAVYGETRNDEFQRVYGCPGVRFMRRKL
jgi:translation initiation factor 4G